LLSQQLQQQLTTLIGVHRKFFIED